MPVCGVLRRQLREGHDGFFQSFAYLSVKARNTVCRVEIVAIEQEVCSIAMVGGGLVPDEQQYDPGTKLGFSRRTVASTLGAPIAQISLRNIACAGKTIIVKSIKTKGRVRQASVGQR